ncbi:MAG: Fic family protein [Opitutaceae bacterium]|jgi:Fic family protein|nr:Fic family protein [Opitutaceae bacterium]
MSQKSKKRATSSVPRSVAKNIRKAGWYPDIPYNDIPLLPPPAPVELETRAVLKQCITARAAVAELKQAAELIPNQGILINTLPMLEARASSEIENIVTTTDRLFQYRQTDEQADPATREALRYSHSLLEGYRTLSTHPLSTRTAERVCSEIKGIAMTVRRVPGTALGNSATGAIIYTPPAGEDHLRELLANWGNFLHDTTRSGLDPLVRMAVAHYQFEAIHPFTDGNGRTGRILNSLFLIQENLLTLPILYLSRHIIAHKADYYSLLLKVTQENAWEEWLLFMLRGIKETARWTVQKIAAMRILQTNTIWHVRRAAPKIYSRELVEAIFELPYCRIQNLAERDIVARQAASRHLKALVGIGVLEEKVTGREKLFIHPKLMRLLTQDDNDIEPYPVN